MNKGLIVLIGVIAVVAIIVMSCVGSYNGLVTKRENVDNQYANLDVMIQRRADLIPNLVNTVEGYMAHENEAIEKVTSARENYLNADSVSGKSEANDEMSAAITNVLALAENYPDLKASENFINLSDELAGTENRIAVARKDYNDAVSTYNTSIKKFPTVMFANMFGFEKADYFETSVSRTEAPVVTFGN